VVATFKIEIEGIPLEFLEFFSRRERITKEEAVKKIFDCAIAEYIYRDRMILEGMKIMFSGD